MMFNLHAISVWTWLVYSVLCQKDGDVRLTGGHSPWTGKLEIYHAHRWGDVCDDDFGVEEATIVCRQLGFLTNEPKFHCCRPGNEKIWLDDLACVGTESSLALCSNPGWGVENCGDSESVSVTCLVDPCINVTCQNGGSCVVTGEHFRCACTSGYTGTLCENDADECATLNGGCSHICTNLIGSYACSCPDAELTLSSDNFTCYAPGVDVHCENNNIHVEFHKKSFPGLHATYITLKEAPCIARDNGTHIIVDVPLKGCGTEVQEMGKSFWYQNVISGRQMVLNGLVTRVRDLNVTVRCHYGNTILAENFYLVNTGELHFTDHGQGTYQVSMDLIHDGKTYQSSGSIPLKVAPGEKLSVKLSLNSNDSHLQVFARNCKATPTLHDEGTQYLILDNGCAHDTTLTINNVTNTTQETLSLETFKFLGNESRVYLHCEVLVCNASDPTSRCRQGCLGSGRRKRDESQSTYLSKDDLSAGPVEMVEAASHKSPRTVKPTNSEEDNDIGRRIMIAGLALLGVALIMATLAITIIARNKKEEDGEAAAAEKEELNKEELTK
ncbi:deleted in malignant brain tumors 1 protein-like [Gigantopelta aegis]|uniref:deleted in malignant brain tumors 1 protein-like n=1 Tax=Gigantopelta aegis TaxID=1735272 RepID=UPI001B88951D|nr:deleted in malignant brain tumors 1 protein-like [Gigantopelta aegis]